MRLTLVAGSELPEHLLADTEHTLRHVGWLGVRRRVADAPPVHVVHYDGVVPPVTLAHAGHDHDQLLRDLRAGWHALGVACALLGDAGPAGLTTDPALAAVDLLRVLAPRAPSLDDFHDDLAERARLLLRLPDAPLPELSPAATELVAAALGPGATRHDAVALAAPLLGLDDVRPRTPDREESHGGVPPLPGAAPPAGARGGDRLPPL